MQAAQSVTNAPRVTLQCVLATMAGQGDRWAQDELLRLYDPMIRSTSMSLMRGSVSQTFEDVAQMSSMALLRLTQTFRMGAGAVFTTYAYNYLGRDVRRDLDDTDAMVRIPAVHKVADRKRFKETGVARFKLAQTASIDHATGTDGEETICADDLLAYLSPESVKNEGVAITIDAQKAMKALNQLRPLDRQIVAMRLFKEMSFQEIGLVVGRTHQGAINAYTRGMGRLRRLCGAPQIEDEEIGVCAKKRGSKRKEATQ